MLLFPFTKKVLKLGDEGGWDWEEMKEGVRAGIQSK